MLLVEKLLQNMAESQPDIDVLLVPGDIVAHGIAVKTNKVDKGNYQVLREVLADVSKLF